MTDRELLEAAARAIGLKPSDYPADTKNWAWNPLTDDGDALRLAVRLGLTVDAGAHQATDGVGTWSGQVDKRDGYAATRRAIVRAAAAMAEQGVLGAA